MNPVMVKYIKVPLAQRYVGRRRWGGELRKMAEEQWLPNEKLKQNQLKRLQTLLRYAANYVPYYKKVEQSCIKSVINNYAAHIPQGL